MNFLESIMDMTSGSINVPDKVWNCDELEPHDIKLYYFLLKAAYKDDHPDILISDKGGPVPTVFASQKLLSELSKMTVTRVKSSLKRLEEVRLVQVNLKRNKIDSVSLLGEFYGHEPAKPKLRKPKKKPKTTVEKLQGKVVTEDDKEIYELAQHYDMLVRRIGVNQFYRSLSKTYPKTHKNWKRFEQLYRLCKERGWDGKVYLECQFERAKLHWKGSNNLRYPYPHMICSENSVKFFENWIKEKRRLYGYEEDDESVKIVSNAKDKVKKILEEIEKSVDTMLMRIGEGDNDVQRAAKVLEVYNYASWYSDYYLFTVSWYRDCVLRSDHEELSERKKLFKDLINNPNLLKKVMYTARRLEEERGIAKNPVHPDGTLMTYLEDVEDYVFEIMEKNPGQFTEWKVQKDKELQKELQEEFEDVADRVRREVYGEDYDRIMEEKKKKEEQQKKKYEQFTNIMDFLEQQGIVIE